MNELRIRIFARRLSGALRRWVHLGSGAIAFWALTPALALSSAGSEPTVIMISLDGTTPAAVKSKDYPTFAALLERGAAAERLEPVFPTLTFPNHVSLVTGVRPAVHGIVGNTFLDPDRGRYRYGADPTWIEVEPLWSIADRHGVVSASYYWVGSEGPWRGGHGPLHWKPFDARTPEADKVEQILAWLDLPDPARRPRLITAWFHGADGTGHRHGPGSPEVREALAVQDAALARLVSGLDERNALATTTLLLVSDHGMTAVSRHVDLAAALRREGVEARVFGAGGFASVAVSDAVASNRAVAVARGLGLEAYLREEAPEELGLQHRRFGEVVVLAPVGTAIASVDDRRPAMRGAHGYRPSEPDMAALLLAVGRGASAGLGLGHQRAVDVTPTVLALLGIPVPTWMEGRPIAQLVPPLADRECAHETTPSGGR